MRTAGFVAKGALLAALLLVIAWIAAVESLLVLVFPAVALMGVLAAIWRRRPERAALALVAMLVLGGTGHATVDVLSAISEERVDYHGALDANEILNTFHPFRTPRGAAPRPVSERLRYAHMVSGKATVTARDANVRQLAAWSLGRFAPWLLAAVAVGLVLPIIRAAEHGDPFTEDAAWRLYVVGLLLLVTIPLSPVFRYVLTTFVAPSTTAAPLVTPTMTFDLRSFLPGAAALVLAGVFRRGAELRELERRTV